MTSRLLDALATVLSSPIGADALLIETARIVAREMGHFCMIERAAGEGTRVVGLAHPDPALAQRMRSCHEPHVCVSGARAARILQQRAPIESHAMDDNEVRRHGLTVVERWIGRMPSSFVAVPLIARGETFGVFWMMTTQRAEKLAAVETASIARVVAVVSLALSAASAAPPPRRGDARPRLITDS